MMTKTKMIAANYPVPQNKEEASGFVHKIGIAQREAARLKAEMNDKMAEIKEEYEKQARPFAQDIEGFKQGLHIWCEANRDKLTNGGKVKFHKFPTGEVNWRKKPAKVSLRGTDKVIKACHGLGLDRFIRIKEEINKEAMLAEAKLAASIQGVSIGSEGEDFVIKPFETELEEVADALK